jgi:hypothetical protein
MRNEIRCLREDLDLVKVEMKWLKTIGYYMSGIMTLQLVAIIATKI